MVDANAMRTPEQSGILSVWVLDVRGLLRTWSVWILGLIVSTIVCRLLLDPYDISKTWPFELWYGLHVILAAVCVVGLWLGTRHLQVGMRRLGIIAIHAMLGFIAWVVLIIGAFWSDFLPFIK
jgi:hypothetical protein